MDLARDLPRLSIKSLKYIACDYNRLLPTSVLLGDLRWICYYCDKPMWCSNKTMRAVCRVAAHVSVYIINSMSVKLIYIYR